MVKASRAVSQLFLPSFRTTPERLGAPYPLCTSHQRQPFLSFALAASTQATWSVLTRNQEPREGDAKVNETIGEMWRGQEAVTVGVSRTWKWRAYLYLRYDMSYSSGSPGPQSSSGHVDGTFPSQPRISVARQQSTARTCFFAEWSLCSKQEAAHLRYWRPHRLNSRPAKEQASAQHIQKTSQTCLVLFNSSKMGL